MDVVRLLLVSCLLTSALAISPSQFKLQHSIHAHSHDYTPEAENDRVDELPGAPNDLDFGLFSGYVTVDDAAGRALFYIFAEARDNPKDAPLLLWLNGGPGCSSIGGGFMSELGPYFPRKDGKSLQDNPYSWNRVANVLWLESPAFVGFSYSNTSADAVVGDARTAVDARIFLLHWLKRFPQYADREFYISGESYGGHYVPNLAWEIVQGNKRAEESAAAEGVAVSPGKGNINLKGFFVGNAWTDAYTDNKGALDYWWHHAMISDESYHAIRDNCDFNTIGPLMRGSEALTLPGTHSAISATATASSHKQHQQQQQQHTAPKSKQNSVQDDQQAPALSTAESTSDSSDDSASSSRLGHSRVTSWDGYGSSSTTQYWEAVGGPSFQHNDDKDMICAKWLDIAFREQGDINIYQIYADTCPPRDKSKSASATASASSATVSASAASTTDKSLISAQKSSKYRGALLGSVTPSSQNHQSVVNNQDGSDHDSNNNLQHPRHPPRYDPCIEDEVERYLNLPEVQAALHANQTVKLPWQWTDCTRMISYSREDLLSSMIPTYKKLLNHGLKIWVYSGDVDGIVPVTGSRRWTAGLNLPVVKPWRAWNSKTGQVGGWRIDYQGLTFATVRNAGHMVPYVQPERGYHLLKQFLFEEQPQPSGIQQ